MAEDTLTFDPPITGGIVVGYDGSATGADALAWALHEAVLRGCGVHAVEAWTLSSAAPAVGAPFGVVPSLAECEAVVRARLAAAVEAARAAAVRPDVVVSAHVVHGPAAQALIAASRRAALVVVGDRGLGGFLDLVLGSVADQVLRHAHCPVVLVHNRPAP
jgi:nucleotide-binding universal stress UspA family protein